MSPEVLRLEDLLDMGVKYMCERVLISWKLLKMRKFYIKSVICGVPDSNVIETDGFEKAEIKAIKLYNNLLDKGFFNDDTYVCLSDNLRDVLYLDTDVYVLKKDRDGMVTWFRNVYGTYCLSHRRLINDFEKYEMEQWRKEKEIHIGDLSEDELKKLYNEICIGSIYRSDFENFFHIDENEVFIYCESYERYLEDFSLENSSQNFVKYTVECTNCYDNQ